MTEMQAFLLLLARSQPGGVLYVAGHVTLPDIAEIERGNTRALRDPKKGEDLRSVTRKLERMIARGWMTVSKETFYRITDDGRAALLTASALDRIRVMVERYDARQALWNKERGQ